MSTRIKTQRRLSFDRLRASGRRPLTLCVGPNERGGLHKKRVLEDMREGTNTDVPEGE